MCFSNLPIEFDEDGNPSLGDEAADVTRPATDGADDGGAGDGGSMDEGDPPHDLTEDPQGTYRAILSSLPEGTRRRIDAEATERGTASGDGSARPAADGDGELAGGD